MIGDLLRFSALHLGDENHRSVGIEGPAICLDASLERLLDLGAAPSRLDVQSYRAAVLEDQQRIPIQRRFRFVDAWSRQGDGTDGQPVLGPALERGSVDEMARYTERKVQEIKAVLTVLSDLTSPQIVTRLDDANLLDIDARVRERLRQIQAQYGA